MSDEKNHHSSTNVFLFRFSGGEGVLYVEATKPGKVTLIGLYLETKCIEQLTISVIYKDASGLEEDNFLVRVKMLLFYS